MFDIPLSAKYRDFLRSPARVDILEGTTYAGKTTVGAVKFMLKVAGSSKKQHIISGLDSGTIAKNIVTRDLGVLDVFAGLVEFCASKGADTMPHLLYHTPTGDKIIYLLGYDNKARWKKALGGQYGCVYIDEANVADLDYLREVSMRCDYMLMTLNPDDPSLPVYKQYINHARPLDKYANDGPHELLEMLDQPEKPGWIWWYFSFSHNAALTAEKRAQIIASVPSGTKIYRNKILGLRGRAEGLVFSNFDAAKHVIGPAEIKSITTAKPNKKGAEYIVTYSAGLDTSYSAQSADTIAMIFLAITSRGRCIILAEKTYNNADQPTPLAPSDTVIKFISFLEVCRALYGLARNVFVDSADQATITELHKYVREHGSVYQFNNAHKKIKIIDRINLQLGWLAHNDYLVAPSCIEHIRELETYSWASGGKDNTPEDANDHTINAAQYAWIPFRSQIGGGDDGNDN